MENKIVVINNIRRNGKSFTVNVIVIVDHYLKIGIINFSSDSGVVKQIA